MNSRTRLLLVVLPLLLSVPRPTVAECIGMPIRPIADQAALVFGGTVMNIAANTASGWGGQIITFDVDRVWKGSPTKQFVIYSFTRTPEPFEFTIGTKYVVLAHIQTTEERTHFGLAASAPATFGVGQCGEGTRTYEHAKTEIADLGPGRAPVP
jgi:hypothetical protein